MIGLGHKISENKREDFDAIDYLKHKILFDLKEDKKESASAIFRVDVIKNIKNSGISYKNRVPKTSLTVA